MLRLQTTFSAICSRCGRFIRMVVSLPLGKSCTYACKECKNELVAIFFSKENAFTVHYLQNTVGGVGQPTYVDL